MSYHSPCFPVSPHTLTILLPQCRQNNFTNKTHENSTASFFHPPKFTTAWWISSFTFVSCVFTTLSFTDSVFWKKSRFLSLDQAVKWKIKIYFSKYWQLSPCSTFKISVFRCKSSLSYRRLFSRHISRKFSQNMVYYVIFHLPDIQAEETNR